ncbi:MAG: TULIP family P47-like protein [Bacteroidota bacterium]
MNIHGWDTVFAISVDKVNSALASNNGTIPEAFDFTQGGLRMSGTFDAWHIVNGGSGNLLRMNFPIKTGSFQMPGQSAVSLAGITLVAEVHLALLPEGNSSKRLTFDIKAVGKNGQTGPGLITPVTLLDPQHHLTSSQFGLVFSLLPTFMVTHAQQVSFVFATVNFAPPNSNSWLTPVKSDYAFIGKNDGSSFLAILSVTRNRDTSRLERKVDPGIIKTGANSGILISRDLFLANVIQPSMPSAYPHTSSGNFVFSASDHSIRNRGSLRGPDAKAGAITYHPVISSLRTTVNGGNLSTNLSGSTDMHAGITMTYQIATSYSLGFNTGNQSLTFRQNGTPSSSHHASIPWYLAFMGPLAILIIEIIVPILANEIAASLNGAVSSSITQTPPQTVKWKGAEPMRVHQALLDQNFLMQGTV